MQVNTVDRQFVEHFASIAYSILVPTILPAEICMKPTGNISGERILKTAIIKKSDIENTNFLYNFA